MVRGVKSFNNTGLIDYSADIWATPIRQSNCVGLPNVHSRKSTSVNTDINNGRILFSCFSFRVALLCTLGDLSGTQPLWTLWVTPVLCLKISAVKRPVEKLFHITRDYESDKQHQSDRKTKQKKTTKKQNVAQVLTRVSGSPEVPNRVDLGERSRNVSPDLQPAWRWVDNDWIVLSGWIYPHLEKSKTVEMIHGVEKWLSGAAAHKKRREREVSGSE